MNEIDVLLALGMLLVVPMGLSMITWTDPQAERLRALAYRAIPFAAVLGALSVVPREAAYQESIGGVLSGLWLAVCLLVGMSAVAEVTKARPGRLEGYLPIAACLFLVVGAVWLVLWRADVRPSDLPIEIVQLTAVHFLFAGFGGPILAAQAARWLRALPGRWDGLAAFAGLGVVLAMILVAAGIMGSPLLELEGSILMALSLIAIAAGTTLIAWRLPVPARILLIASSAAVWIAMVLAVQYAVGQYLVVGGLSVRDMARTHGVLNVIFTVFGLAGWKLAGQKVTLGERPAAAAPPEPGAAPAGSPESPETPEPVAPVETPEPADPVQPEEPG
ncbi:MAG: YndJ family transporter [Actinomycetota bacterium]